MKQKIDYNEFIEFLGFQDLTTFEKELLTECLKEGHTEWIPQKYIHPKDSVLSSPRPIQRTGGVIHFLLLENLKYLLEQNSKSDKIIEQNNQIIELLQKIADK